MIWQKVMKYPVLVMGIIMFLIFLNQETTKVWWAKVKRRYVPSTCDAVLSRVETKAPKEWKLECPGTQLLVIQLEIDHPAKSSQQLRVMMYKEVANNLTKLASYANIETLEYLKNIRLILKHKDLTIISQTDGQAVAQFKTLKQKQDILNHLSLTVKVREISP